MLFAKSFGHDADLFIFDEPIVGVDMGTRTALYRLIDDIATSGKAVIVISSDLPEVLNLSHKVLVMSEGRQLDYLILISLGQLLVLISGGFDLSVGTVIALSSVISASVR